MPEKETPKLVRYRETRKSDPSGFSGVVHTMERVVEAPAPAPEGSEITTDEPHGWKIKETK